MKKIKAILCTVIFLIVLTFMFFHSLTFIFPPTEATVMLDSEGRGRLTDPRDEKVYKVTKIGEQIWMAENLNYDGGKGIGKCYDNDLVNCEKYGRLYNWNEAMKVCPKGWHLPSYEEWQMPYAYLGGGKEAINKLKAKNDWEKGNGTDDYGFSALPGGYYYGIFEFEYIGILGYWWSATEAKDSNAMYLDMFGDDSGFAEIGKEYSIGDFKFKITNEEDKTLFMSVRCVKNNG